MAGEATIHELEELDKLMKQNEEWKKLADQLTLNQSTYSEADETEAEAAFTAHSLKMEMGGHIDKNVTRVIPIRKTLSPLVKWTIRVAAVLVLAIGGIYTFKLLSKEDHTAVATNEIVTKKGSTSQVTLPDGTKVRLNSDSKITYVKDFGSKIREVTLIGEAYFDVVHDDSKPFVIHAGNMNIKDLGTVFNVKFYPQDEAIETSLIQGKIEVTFNDKADKYVLHPNDKLVIRKDQAQLINSNSQSPMPRVEVSNITKSDDNIVFETAWTEKKLAFNNETLENIANSLERKFDVTIVFKNDEVKNYSYTAIYEEESLDKILQYLSLSKHFSYTKNGKVITIGQ